MAVDLSPSGGGGSGASIPFIISEWVIFAGQYMLELTHGLETKEVNVELWENEISEIDVDRIEIFNTNKVRLYTPINPDCRFAGKAIINQI